MLKFIKTAGFSLVGAIVTLIPAAAATFIYFSVVTVEPSFWLGFGGLFGLAVAFAAFYWASSPRTRQWPGTFIGFGAAMAMLITGIVWKPFENFSGGDFGLGLLTLGLMALMAGIVYGAHWLINKFA